MQSQIIRHSGRPVTVEVFDEEKDILLIIFFLPRNWRMVLFSNYFKG